jgi:acetyl esterase/lipase
MANGVGAVVVSTHYRQGPEDKFPAAHDDTLAAYRWRKRAANQPS